MELHLWICLCSDSVSSLSPRDEVVQPDAEENDHIMTVIQPADVITSNFPSTGYAYIGFLSNEYPILNDDVILP